MIVEHSHRKHEYSNYEIIHDTYNINKIIVRKIIYRSDPKRKYFNNYQLALLFYYYRIIVYYSMWPKRIYSAYKNRRLSDIQMSESLCSLVEPTGCPVVKITAWETFKNLFRDKNKNLLKPLTPEEIENSRVARLFNSKYPL